MDTAGPNGALQIFGVSLIGATPENGRKLLLTIGFVAVALLLSWVMRRVAPFIAYRRAAFWARQIVNMLSAVIVLLGVMSIWFDDPNRLTTALGLVTAGLAFALQRVITAVAGYLVILRGQTFNVGDRIVMGGVRGDVVALSFMQTTILEMGQSSQTQDGKAAMWVHSRQYTGRLVTVTNAKVFEEPVYNYTRDLPFIWEEMRVPLRYEEDAAVAEAIMLEAAQAHTAAFAAEGGAAMARFERRYSVPRSNVNPRVYWRLTDNWLELTVRFFVRDHGVREVKDAMSRDILRRFDEHGLTIASTTVEVVGVPALTLARTAPDGSGQRSR